MAGAPFKMKGSPFQRNFGIGSPVKTTYKEAYAGLSAEKKKKQTEAEFIEEAKAWNIKTYGTTEPTKEAKKLVGKYKSATDVESGKKKLKKIVKSKEEKKKQHEISVKEWEEKGKTMTREARNKALREAKEKHEESLKTKEGRKKAKEVLKESKKSLKQKKREGTISKEEYKVAREGIKIGKKKIRKARRKAFWGKVGKFVKEKVVKLEDPPTTMKASPTKDMKTGKYKQKFES